MNSSIVIALPKIDDAKKIRTILNRHGFSVAAVCSTASTALASMSELDGGILICGYKLTDRYYRDVLEDIPSYFEMLLLASGRVIAEAPTSVLTVEMPMKVSDLVNTVDMMLSQIERRLKKEKKKPKTRSWKEQNYQRKVSSYGAKPFKRRRCIPVHSEMQYGFRDKYGRDSSDGSDAVI